MSTDQLKKIETQIRTLLGRLSKTGAMRPGTLTVQYRNPKDKKTPFNQLSYTHKGKSRSEYVRPECLADVRREIDEYQKFKKTTEQITALSLEASKLRHKRK